MKILFLDVDGVLNSEESFGKNYQERRAAEEAGTLTPRKKALLTFPLGHLCPKLIGNLNLIVKLSGCKIVLSSTWRKARTIEEMRALLVKRGFQHAKSLIDKTGNDPNGIRGKEIQDWLDAHPEVTHYAILDDDSFDIVGERAGDFKHPKNFVHVDMRRGLTPEYICKVLSILHCKI